MFFMWVTIIFGVAGVACLFAGIIAPGLALLAIAFVAGMIFDKMPDSR
jgi:hypothetical protein